jgi:hypothetical protein
LAISTRSMVATKRLIQPAEAGRWSVAVLDMVIPFGGAPRALRFRWEAI